jgi:hypothetical protein
MEVAKKMVRELKGKEQAIKWGIVRNDKKEVKKIKTQDEKEHRDYYEQMRKDFLEFVSAQHTEDL